MFFNTDLPNDIKQEIVMVNNFLASKGIKREVNYNHHTYNVKTQSDVSIIYNDMEEHSSGDYFVKVADGVITEYYIANYTYAGEKVYGVSFDATTDKIVDVYRIVPEGLTKTCAETGKSTTIHFTLYHLLPDDLKEELKDFPYNRFIFSYARNDDGRTIVEYKKYNNLLALTSTEIF